MLCELNIKMCIRFIIVLLLVLHLSFAQDEICDNGEACMIIKKCKNVYNTLKQLHQTSWMELLQKLHCGFEGLNSKICCRLESRNLNGIDLLPNKTVCGIDYKDRIVGGKEVDVYEHPWMVLIKYQKPSGSSFSCGGVLISSRYVMTAAHCIKKMPTNWILSQVRLGEWNLSSRIDCVAGDCSPEPLDVDVEETIVHERYNKGSNHNDIALLRLARDIPFTDFIKPICLPIDFSLQRNTFENYDLEVAGWGQTEKWLNSEVKLKVSVTVRSTRDCQEAYTRFNRTITKDQICAGGLMGQDSCKGDSGGPLMGQVDVLRNWVALGVVSYGPSPCGTAGWPGVYTRVTSYVDWILSKIRP